MKLFLASTPSDSEAWTVEFSAGNFGFVRAFLWLSHWLCKLCSNVALGSVINIVFPILYIHRGITKSLMQTHMFMFLLEL